MLNGNTKALLIRKTPFNYEEWTGSKDDETIIDGMDMWDGNNPVPELVSLRIDYRIPDEAEQAEYMVATQHKNIHFFVCPSDQKELKWAGENMTFNFDVAEGEGKVDITQVLSATLHGKSSDQIKYFVRGVVLANGDVSFHEDLSDNCGDEEDVSAAVKKLVGNAANATFRATALPDQDLHLALNNSNQAASPLHSQTNKDLKDFVVDGRLTLYHSNYNQVGKEKEMFDAYQRKYYSFFVEALYHNTDRDQSCVESCLALVNIHVNPPKSGFHFDKTINNAWCHEVTETRGETDRRTASEHNPPITIKEIIQYMRHEDSKADNDDLLKPGDSDLSDGFKVEICKLDEALELCHVDSNILNSYIKLRETDSNKSTESPSMPISTKNAKYVHYNYERQSQYDIEIEFCLDTLVELPVTKCSNNYVCGFGDITDTTELQAIANGKTCSFLADLSTDERAGTTLKTGQLNDDKLYYFQNPETKLFEGPLSTKPHTLDQLKATRTLYNVKDLKYAYVRVQTQPSNAEEFTALYKTPEFRNDMDKKPKPTDCTKQVFAIKVKNALDNEQTCPQPYELKDKECHDYCGADPIEENILDADEIMVDAGETHITYVFAEHKDFYKVADMSDFAPDEGEVSLFTPPEWHTDTDKVAGKKRTIFHSLKMTSKNSGGMYSSTKDGSANGSIRFGKYEEDDEDNIVPLTFFVEFHDGCIDESGWRETSMTNVIGKQVDYSGTVQRYQYKSKDASGSSAVELVANSDCDLYELINKKINKFHGKNANHNTNESNNYYTTAEIAFGKDYVAETDKVYRFSVAAVLNVHATHSDLSYNENMVDFQNKFYKDVVNGVKQPFQQYVYDREQEAVVTVAYARKIDPSVGTSAKINNAGANDRFSAPLLVCRSHFKVCTKDGTEKEE